MKRFPELIIDTPYNKVVKIVKYLTSLGIPNTCAIIDIDDTIIDTKTWKCIPELIEAIQILKRNKIAIFYVTARDSRYRKDTVDDLLKCGIKVKSKQLILRSPDLDPGKFKKDERKKISREHIVLMTIGDSIWDVGRYGGVGLLLS